MLSATADDAVARLRVRALAGETAAMMELGNDYFFGKGAKVDYSEAFYWYQAAANKDDPSGCYNLALCHERGLGTPANHFMAFMCFQRAAKLGVSQAAYNLGTYYRDGMSVGSGEAAMTLERDLEKAREFFRQAADTNYAPACRELGKLNVTGQGGAKNLKRGLALLQRAVELGDATAALALANYYESIAAADPKALDKRVQWLKRAADQEIPEALFQLALCYEAGKGVKSNQKLASGLYRRAAGKGHTLSMLKLAEAYANGRGVEPDIAAAKHWYAKAAELSDPAANFFLGVYAMQGMGTAPAPAQAARYFLKAAQAGHVQAQFNLGCCYLDGNGAPKDPQMAFFWFKKAADSGDPAALRQIGYCYLDGVGVAPDAEEGAAYLGQAAKRGDLEAKAELERMSAEAKRAP